MTSANVRGDQVTFAAASEGAEILLSFGAAMLRAGNTASRTREWIDVLARKLGFDAVSVGLSLDGITASVCRSGARITTMREIGPPAINARRIAALEQLAKTAEPGLSPRAIAVELAEIDAAAPPYSTVQIAAAVGVASAAFGFLNGAAAPEMISAAIGGAIGQCLRLWLSRLRFNHYAVTGISALTASGLYVLAAALLRHMGFEFAHYPSGFIASVLFLIPGFPLIAALFDLLQHQTVAAVSRLAYGVTLLLALTLGLSIIIKVAGLDLSRQPSLELAYPLRLLFRATASFLAASAFAMLFNGSPRAVVAAGLSALLANDLRLVLIDLGVGLAPAAFCAALAIGLMALLTEERFNIPRMAMTVAPTVIMVPGFYAFEMIVSLN